MKRAGQALLIAVVAVAALAPWLAPNGPDQRFPGLLYAPPTRVHILGAGLRAPFIYRQEVISLLERRYEADRSKPISLRWLTGGSSEQDPPYASARGDAVSGGQGPRRFTLVTADPAGGAPLLLLGADSYGRDIFSRLLHGSRITLMLAAVSALAAVLVGTLLGGIAGAAGGVLDDLLSRVSEFVLVLPAMYVVLALRGVMPLVLATPTVFALLCGIFALLGWPVVARGVRAIVAAEREREYVMAARAAGVRPWRLLAVHLLPAARGYIGVQITLLVPAFILAEATMSYVGLGFPDTTPTWGTMLQDAANVAMLGDAPWTLAPAVAIFVVVLAVNLLVQGSGRSPVQLER